MNADSSPRRPVRHAALVWVALMLLLSLTVGSAFIPMGAGNAAVNLLIAVLKTGLVALFFMGLRRSQAVLRMVAAAGLFTLLLLFVLSGLDYATRIIHPAPWQHTPPSMTRAE